MTLGVDNPLLASDIMDVRDLKEGKIFRLTGRDGSALVLKAEPNVSGDSIKAVSSVVKSIDRSARMKPLTAGEVLELKKFTDAKDEYVRLIQALIDSGYNFSISDKEKKSVAALKDCIRDYGKTGPGGRTDIAKMSLANMSTLKVALEVEGKPSDDGAWDEARDMFAKFAKALKSSGGFEKLGQIMAGDFFIGNLDRFNNEGSGIGMNLYGGKHKFKVIYNLGNIILVKPGKGKRSRLSMLDYMDPNTEWMQIDQDIATMEATNQFGNKWPMRVLIDKQSRHTIAKNLVADLDFLLKPESSLFGFSFGGSRSVKRVENGIVEGIRGIAKALKPKQAKLSPLVRSCYQQIQNV